jgi:FMN phosphatase YigB (HAD superfamily)
VATDPIVFLIDLDETLMETERFDHDLAEHLGRAISTDARDRYCAIERELFATLGYRDYLGALQRYRVEHPFDHRLNGVASYILDYPFANRLFPGSLDVLARFRAWGQTVVLTDGDIILQPRKLERSGISEAVLGRALIYIHKELALADIERLYPASHYVLVDDKLRILAAFKKAWGTRVTTVLPRQGAYANDPKVIAAYPPADLSVERISELLDHDLPDLLGAAAGKTPLLFPDHASPVTT